MPYLVAILVGAGVMLLLYGLFDLAAAPSRAVAREIEEIRSLNPSPFGMASRRRRQSRKQQLGDVIRKLGAHAERGGLDLEGWTRKLVQAGYWSPDATRIFFGTRVAVAAGMAFVGLGIGAASDARLFATLVLGVWLGGFGLMLPAWYVLRKRTERRNEIQRTLADALDLLVACVEAGMGLNQAMVRVADEVRNLSQALAEELSMVNLEIRAGTSRSDALRNLGTRTGIDDVEALVSTLVQTDRFGTSVGRALRIQAGTLRQKRRQRAEEAAAKTTIKLIFPLVLFVFPALFVVILGPAVIQVVQALGDM